MAATEACCKNLAFGQVSRFLRDVGVADLGFCRREVGDLRVGQVDRVLQLVFAGSNARLNLSELGRSRSEWR